MSVRVVRRAGWGCQQRGVVRGLALAVGLYAAAVPSTARAQGATAAALAQARYDEGMRAFDARDFVRAQALFAEALRSSGSPNVRFMLARSLRELGRLDEALLEFRLVAREAGDRASSEPRFRATAQAAQRAVTALEPQMGRVIVRVNPSGARASIDGRALPPEALGIELPVMPGAHRIAVDAEGYVAATRSITVARGESQSIELRLDPVPREIPRVVTPLPPVAPVATPPRTRASVPMLVTGSLFLAVGIAGGVTLAIFGPATLDAWATVDRLCDPMRVCDPAAERAIREGPTNEIVSASAIGAVGVGLALGTVFLVVGWPRTEAAPRVQPALSPGGMGWSVRF